MNKVLVFDMDGTIADFYGVDGWLDCLMDEEQKIKREYCTNFGISMKKNLCKFPIDKSGSGVV